MNVIFRGRIVVLGYWNDVGVDIVEIVDNIIQLCMMCTV